ncbi:hypothetical protein DRN79_04985 [Methanosarcinales archaeon]|nr:MAG: hypothetical protein DRN79_04985 [Methanosarcinales archaeon]
MFLVIGVDAMSWDVVMENLERLKNIAKLVNMGNAREIMLEEKPISASIWCGMFCGLLPDEHKHYSYVRDGEIVRREDIDVKFIWDILHEEGKKVYAVNVPFVVPPFSFGTDFKPVGFGLPTDEREWEEELERVTAKTKELISGKPDLLITVFTLLDRVQHFHWGEPCVIEWYMRVDEKIGEIVFETGFLSDYEQDEQDEQDEHGDDRLILISDHGFCSFENARVRTLTAHEGIKGDHSDRAMVVTVNVPYDIKRPQDVFFAIRKVIGKD